MKKTIIGLTAFVLILSAGACAGRLPASEPDHGIDYPAPIDVDMAYEEAPVAGAPGAIGVDDGEYARSESGEASGPDFVRMVIRNANLSLVVEDPVQSLETISLMAEEYGGFVVASSIYQTRISSSSETFNASITIRVEADNFYQVLAELKDSAIDVLNENVYGQDVTQEYTDLESSLRNAELAEQELQEILEQAVDADDILAIYEQLRVIRGEIEMIKGRMQYLEQSVSLSAISVELIADEAAQPIEIGGWRPEGIVKDAIEDLIGGLQSLAEFLIRFGICGLPVLVILGLPLFFILRALRRRRRVASTPGTSPNQTEG